MKSKNYFLLLLLCCAGVINAQIMLNDFEGMGGVNGSWKNSTAGSYTLAGSDDAATGDSSVVLDYTLIADQGWGGSVDLQLISSSGWGVPYADMSGEDGVELAYKVPVPADTAGRLTVAVKLIMPGGTSEMSAGAIPDDQSGTWQTVQLPFSGFSNQGAMELDSVTEIQVQLLSTATGNSAGGVIMYDALQTYSSGGGGSSNVVEQTILEDFEDFSEYADGSGNTYLNSNAGTYTLSHSDNSVEGDSALCIDYNLVGDLSWGGSYDVFVRPDAAGYFPDLSNDDGIKISYRVPTPASDPANLHMNIRILTGADSAAFSWEYNAGNIYGDATGAWQEVLIPFEDLAIPSWQNPSGSEVLALDMLYEVGIQIITQAGVTTTGEVCYDNVVSYMDTATGGGGDTLPEIMIEDFDDIAEFGNGNSWSNGTNTTFNITASSDMVEGSGAMCVDYLMDADLSWGGSIDWAIYPDDATQPFLTDLTGYDGIRFDYKTTTPADTAGRITLVSKIWLNNGEEWHASAGAIPDDTTGAWQEVVLEFDDFAIPSWITQVDGILYLDSISHIEMQLIAGQGGDAAGEICFDNLTAYGLSSIEEVGTVEASIDLYPNPASEILNIESVENMQRVEIYNVNGALVRSVEANNELKATMEISDLNTGIYIVRVIGDNTQRSSKFIKY